MGFRSLRDISAFTLNTRNFWVAIAFFSVLNLTCNSSKSPLDPTVPFDPIKPTIEDFGPYRGSDKITDDLVYSGEDIKLMVQAVSHAWAISCGLGEDDVVENNLIYSFDSVPPENVPAPGVFSQATPPSNEALWRVPDLTNYDSGEGLLYLLRVTVYDECLEKQSTGKMTLRAFANEGPPVVTDQLVRSDINSGSPATEDIDQNGYYEVERADECRINITAASRTSDPICANRGVEESEELSYRWTSTRTDINLTFGENEFIADDADFDIPVTIAAGETFNVTCSITDNCTGTVTDSTYKFIVVAEPVITSIKGTSNGINLDYDSFFDLFQVQPKDEVVFTGYAILTDSGLCDAKGISPGLQWDWQETTGTKPTLNPEFEPLPVPNGESTIDFKVPAVENGTKYNFHTTVTDRCNSLTDEDDSTFMVIVPPDVEYTFVEVNSIIVNPSATTGRYEIYPGDTIRIRVTGTQMSDSSFCQERGIGGLPSLKYEWDNPYDLLNLNYIPVPSLEHSDLIFVVPDNIPPLEMDLTGRITDQCNELVTQMMVPFEVLEPTGE
jgi:hypothetical protein